MKRILVLGAKGMAGHIVSRFLKENTSWEIFDLDREMFEIGENDDWKIKLREINSERPIDYILNFIGLLKLESKEDPILAIKVNTLFPHELANLCDFLKIKIIHLSTDCWEDLDIYGRSKRAGELDYPTHLTLRTSIIGPELKEKGFGLFHWFMNQKGEADGFINHFWDGVTTLELANQIKLILESEEDFSGIMNLRTVEKISKYDLLKIIANVFKKHLILNKKETLIVDKCVSNPEIKIKKSFEKQINELNQWIIFNRELYSQYNF